MTPTKVFLSSTADDLVDYRKVADQTILELRQHSVLMERFGPLPGAPVEECEHFARECDVLICIVAHRYGSVPEKGRGSFTQREVKAAHEAGKDIRVWIVAEDYKWTEKKEQDLLTDPEVLTDDTRVAEVVEAVRALNGFKDWLRATFICDTFTSPDDLGRRISIVLKNRAIIEVKPESTVHEIKSEAELRIAYDSTAKSRHPCNGVVLDDLDWTLVDHFREKELPDASATLSRDQLLRELGLFSPLAAFPVLHNAAVLCFCKRPHQFFPQATSTFMLGQPGDPSVVMSEVTGPLSTQIERLVELTMERLPMRATFDEGGLRKEEAEIPLTVVREGISNAVAHRDYDITGSIQVRLTDAYLEIQNPGRFPPDAPWEAFLGAGMVSRPSDMAIAFYLKRQLAVEAIGRGFAVFRKHLATFGDDAIEWLTPSPETVLMRIKRFAFPARSEFPVEDAEKRTSPREEHVSMARLPSTGSELFGRDIEIKLLDDAWDDPNINIVSLVAWGGVGKTALINHWLKRRMARDNYRGAERIYAWSFYSQGSERAASADLFIHRCLKWFGDSDPTAGTSWDKGERLARYVRQARTLLILDGLEPLQYPPGPQEGRLKDPAVQALLIELAAQQPGLCLISTRQRVGDLAEFENSTVVQHNLEHLSPAAGAEILRSLKVKGEDVELEQASQELGGHALSLTLLGSYLDETLGGDIRRRREVENLFEDTRYGITAQRMIAANEKWLGEGMELSILRVLALFNRPADPLSIQALRQPPSISGLTEPLQHFKSRQWNQAVAKLRRIRLLAEASPSEPNALDAHPLVREYFKHQLEHQRPEAWREANNRLYEYLKATTKEFPESLEEMAPLYAAMSHGTAAGRYENVLDEVYVRRIQRGNEYFSTRRLGAFAAELSALSGFFTTPWIQPIDELSTAHQLLVLNAAGFYLRALGRLQEAAEPLRTALQIAVANEEWKNAAANAASLSQLNVMTGNLDQALRAADDSVRFADQSGDIWRSAINRARLGHVLHQLGNAEDAARMFRAAEETSKLTQSRSYSFPLEEFQFCDLLLDQGQIAEVTERVEQTRRIARSRGWLLDLALNNLLLGRAALIRVEHANVNDITTATHFIHLAVQQLRQAGPIDLLLRGLLARGELHRCQGDFQNAQRDLGEVQRVASRSGMGLHLADCHLEWARFEIAQDKKQMAREHLATAKEMINRMGYHRRDKEVQELEAQLG